jgi:hypothetical protein
VREWAGVEARHGADFVAGEGEDEQPGRVGDPGVGVLDVEAQRGLPVGPRRGEAGPAAGAEPGGGDEPGDQVRRWYSTGCGGMVRRCPL